MSRPIHFHGIAHAPGLPSSSLPVAGHLLPLGAMLLAGSVGAWAQTGQPVPAPETTLQTVTVLGHQEPEETRTKHSFRATDTRIGKGQQALRDIPQTVTVMTERLMDDRNLDDFREVLKATAGITFQAGETGEEDVRMRGFSMQQAGDIYVDGLRDAPLTERDTFNNDRVEVLKGSASMMFGKGSTGGVVNQVSKQPFLMSQHEVNATLGGGKERRLTGDFNFHTGDSAAFRLNLMKHDADQYGAEIHKTGVAPTFRWGIGLRDEFSVGLYHLETNSKPLYNHPWVLANGLIQPTLPAKNYHGMASDHLSTQTDFVTLSHKHRFDHTSELKTTVRHGQFERDLWASTVSFCNRLAPNTGNSANSGTAQRNACPDQSQVTGLEQINDNTILFRSPKGRKGSSDVTQVQSEFTNSVELSGIRHSLITGADVFQEKALRNPNTATGYNYYGNPASPDPAYTTTVGTPNDGEAWTGQGPVNMNKFKSASVGLYAQDTVAMTQTLKLLGGLRLDHFKATYQAATAGAFSLDETLMSNRLGVLFQPSENQSFYASYGTSYNTSGDTYQYALNLDFTSDTNTAQANRKLLNTAPEKSRNIELGGKFELFDKKASLGVALFHTEKYNERNTDEPSTDSFLLSGKRHASGVELNLAGRITPRWDVFYNHTWIPSARIDESSVPALNCNATPCTPNNAQQQGDRPALTPRHSASLWTSYRVASDWRVGFGLNHRGEQNPEGNRSARAKAFTTADAMVEYTISDTASLKLNVSNLTNALYADTLYRGFYTPGAPRTAQLTLKTVF